MSVRDNLMINGNTDEEAQKIMDAMDGDVAKEDSVQRILGKLNSGVAGVTSQTKGFTETKFGTLGTSDTTITGSGRIAFWNGSGAIDYLALTVDDVVVSTGEEMRVSSGSGVETIHFEKSVVAKSKTGGRISYIVQT